MILDLERYSLSGYDQDLNEKEYIESKIQIQNQTLKANIPNDPSCHIYRLKIALKEEPQLIFCNGFQSWSVSNWFQPNSKISQLRFSAGLIWKYFQMDKYGDQPFLSSFPNMGSLYSFDYIIFKYDGNYCLIGSQNTKCIYTYLKNKNELVIYSTERNAPYVFSQGKLSEVFLDFANQESKPWFRTQTGWTSWYNFYTDITPDLLENQVTLFKEKKIPIDFFQIDDGWQNGIGDWSPNDEFLHSMQKLSKYILESGYIPGIWLAPFIVEESIKKTIPKNWIRKNQKGDDIVAGRSLYWSGKFYTLEWKNPEVKKHIQQSLKRVVNDWGFKMLKLDFLYAASLGLDPSELSNSINEINQIIKDSTEGAKILACGAINDFNQDYTYLRVGADVSHYWEDRTLGNFVQYRERVSTLASLRNTTNRSLWSYGGIGIDPDVFIIKQKKSKLNHQQTQTLFLINVVLGNLAFTSDDLLNYDDQSFQIYNSQFPVIERRIDEAHIEDVDAGWIMLSTKSSQYLLVYNLRKNSIPISLPSGKWASSIQIHKNKIELKGYQSLMMKKFDEHNLVIYSDGHVFPGEEFSKIKVENNRVELVKKPNSKTISKIKVRVQNDAKEILFNDQSYNPFQFGNLKVIELKIEPSNE